MPSLNDFSPSKIESGIIVISRSDIMLFGKSQVESAVIKTLIFRFLSLVRLRAALWLFLQCV